MNYTELIYLLVGVAVGFAGGFIVGEEMMKEKLRRKPPVEKRDHDEVIGV